MKVNFKKNYTDCFGNPVMEKRDGQECPLVIGVHLSRILFNLSALGGSPLSGGEKYMAYSLGCRMAGNPSEVQMTAEEASFLKRVCAEMLSAGAYGRVVDIIEDK